MLKTLKILLAIVAMAITAYGVITKYSQFNTFVIFFAGLVMLVSGLEEFKKDNKKLGWFLIGVFIFSIFAVVQSSIHR